MPLLTELNNKIKTTKGGLQRLTSLHGWIAAQNSRNEKIPRSIQELGLIPQSSVDTLIWSRIAQNRIIDICACKNFCKRCSLVTEKQDHARKTQSRFL